MSFNTITELPKEIGRLTPLEHLTFATKLPEDINLRLLDCRRNNISDISVAYTLPKFEKTLRRSQFRPRHSSTYWSMLVDSGCLAQ
jgi:Leucine-rich repeat (LRR) protein